MFKKVPLAFSSLKFKFIVITILLFSVFISATLYLWYSSSVYEAEKTAKSYITSLIEVSNADFEKSLNDINRLVILLSCNSGNYFSGSNIINVLSGESSYTLQEAFTYKKAASDYITSLLNFKNYLNGLMISDINGNSLAFSDISSFEVIISQSWYKDILNAKSNSVVIPPHFPNTWSKLEKDKVLSIASPIFIGDTAGGFVIADLSSSILNDIFSIDMEKDLNIMVMDSKSSKVIYSRNTLKASPDFSQSVINNLQQNFTSEKGSFYSRIENKDYLIVYHISKFTNWTTMGIIPKDSLMEGFSNTRNRIVFLGFIFIPIAALIIYFTTSVLTRNLLKLNNAFRKLNKDNLDISVEIHSKDEVGQLYKQFNSMIERINNLISEIKQNEREKRKAEIRALQAQINPHFLYNTLNTIKFLSILQGADNIKTVSESLSTLLHINMDKRPFITIEEEIQYLKSYLSIQKYRYNDKFTSNFIIEDDLEKYMLPKLLLQPIVENSLIHGIAPLKTTGAILVKVHKEGDNTLKIRIQDNGIGISEEKLSCLFEPKSNSIGLYNVYERIKMNFGDSYGISVLSQQNLYTMVDLSIPLLTEEDIIKYA